MNNIKVRLAMTKKGMQQKDLADCLGKKEPEISIMLKNELSPKVQNEIIEKIKNYEKGEK